MGGALSVDGDGRRRGPARASPRGMIMDAAEAAARASYGRLLSMLAVRTGDLAGAEDALADAFLAAVESWPRGGVPRNPDAWLWTAARRRLIDGARRRKLRAEKEPLLEIAESLGLEPESEST